MTRRFLLLGESPNKATEGRPELWLLPDHSTIQHSANRLLHHTGWSLATYLRVFPVRDNLVHQLPARGGKGRTFSRADGLIGASRVVAHSLEEHVDGIVMLGRRVASCFRFARRGERQGVPGPKWPWLSWGLAWAAGDPGTVVRAAVVPHPSGINQWWNDLDNQCDARTFFGELLCSDS